MMYDLYIISKYVGTVQLGTYIWMMNIYIFHNHFKAYDVTSSSSNNNNNM